MTNSGVATTKKAVRRPITAAQRDALCAFRAYQAEFSVAPSYLDLANRLGVSKSTARDHVGRLLRDGCLTLSPSRYRGWVLTPRGRRLSHVDEAGKGSARG